MNSLDAKNRHFLRDIQAIEYIKVEDLKRLDSRHLFPTFY